MNFTLTILGSASALPFSDRNPSAQALSVHGRLFLCDCGEGTQRRMRQEHLGFVKIQAIFLSHIHGDHCFGLIGMISTFGLLGRTARLHVHAPEALGPELDRQIRFFTHDLGFEVVFYPVDTTQRLIVYEDNSITVESIPLEHRVPCCGYLIKEKQTLPHIRREMMDCYGIPSSQVGNIKNGADWTTADGEVIPNSRLVTPADKARSYAYISDTRYMPSLHEQLTGVDTLYHESTYGEDHLPQSEKYYHSTAHQAAMVASEAGVGKLLLGHYSSRYLDELVLLKEAKEVFNNTFLTNEMDVFDV